MNKKISTIVVTGMLLIAAPVFAQDVRAGIGARVDARVGSSTIRANAEAKMQTRITTAKERATQEIDRRIEKLNALNTRVQAMTHVSDTMKTNVASTISTEVSNLTALKAKIEAETEIEALKTDIKSIATSYRIFLLVIPQGHIQVASDKSMAAADSMTTLAGKLETRITEAQQAGSDVTALTSALVDMKAKVDSARVSAQAAVDATASLTPDNGDKTKMTANQAALKDARAKIQSALKDIQAARADAKTIVQGLKSLGASASASTNTDASTQ